MVLGADLLVEMGAHVHLAYPLGNNWGTGGVKNDARDAHDLVALLRLSCLAEAWIAPPLMQALPSPSSRQATRDEPANQGDTRQFETQ